MPYVLKPSKSQQFCEQDFLFLFEKKAKEFSQQGRFEGVTPSEIFKSIEYNTNTIFFSDSRKLYRAKLSQLQMRVLCCFIYGYGYNMRELMRFLGTTDSISMYRELRFLYSSGYLDINFSGRRSIYLITLSGRAAVNAHFARLAELKRKARKIIYKYFPLANRNYKYVTPKKHKEKLEALRGKRLK